MCEVSQSVRPSICQSLMACEGLTEPTATAPCAAPQAWRDPEDHSTPSSPRGPPGTCVHGALKALHVPLLRPPPRRSTPPTIWALT
ncbi:unnamed protein product [Boreogadus saida]